jgi:hypothetical protein
LIDPHVLPTRWSFEYGTTAGFEMRSPARPAVLAARPNAVEVSTVINNPLRGPVYDYTLVAVNRLGTTIAPDHKFKL